MKRMYLILLALLVSSTNGADRETVAGEITPISAEQSSTYKSYEAGYAIDRNGWTNSYAEPDSDGIAWLKVNLGQVYCIDRVIKYIYYTNGRSDIDRSWSCTEEECTCDWSCYGVLLSVYTEGTTSTGNVPSTYTGCRLGDTVKLYREDWGSVGADELAITAKLANCTALDQSIIRKNVVTEPQLPTEHGTAITLGCTAGNTNTGGSQATCQNGMIVLIDESPLCLADCTTLEPTWKNVVTDPDQLTVEHGQEMTLGCTAGHTNTGGSQATCQNGTIVLTDEPPLCLELDLSCTALIDNCTKDTTCLNLYKKYSDNCEEEVYNTHTNSCRGKCKRSLKALFSDPLFSYERFHGCECQGETRNLCVKEKCKLITSCMKDECPDEMTATTPPPRRQTTFSSTPPSHSLTVALGKTCRERPDSTWENVVIDPQLPVVHGTAITLGCTAGHTNTGGNKATCEDGELDLTDGSPVCLADCTALDSTWENVVTDPQLPVEHGTAITLGCTAGHTNTGGETASCQNGQIVPTDEPPQCLVMCQDSNMFYRIRAIAFKEARDAFVKQLKRPGGPNPNLFSKSWISRQINRSETFVKKNWKRDPYDLDC